MQLAIIGGGAAGLMAAIAASQYQDISVTIYESGPMVAKKILATGNGKCNFTNLYMKASCFRSKQSGFPMQVISSFDEKKTLDFFLQLGVPFMEKNGYCYPHSEQASTIREALLEEVSRKGVHLLCETPVAEISVRDRFILTLANGEKRRADRVILAAGGMAAPKTGSDGSGYTLAGSLGHRIIPPVPSLVQLRCSDKICKKLHGVRVKASIRLFSQGKKLADDYGEIQMTDYGLSGIPIFQVSRYASYSLAEGKEVKAELDFLSAANSPDWKTLVYVRKKHSPDSSVFSLLHGLFSNKLALGILFRLNLDPNLPLGKLTTSDLNRLEQEIHHFSMKVTAVNGFDQAQVTAGGVSTRELNPDTMESRLCPGLYFAGEIIDVDGICGGYNLQWAWSSGWLAGSSAAAGMTQKTKSSYSQNRTKGGKKSYDTNQ
ncbi:MAG: NAD(P)/FAD-dependent oxidoreductase [Clostridiales bacterium]|nr:NAD(P)/FAD-dependent oxidoreductase [Clostridiales bacterium]